MRLVGVAPPDYIPDSNKQNSVLMYYAAGILASSETAGGRPGWATSCTQEMDYLYNNKFCITNESSCLGPCSRSLSRAKTPSPRVSLTITLRRSVPTRSSCVVRCLPNTLLTCQYVYTSSAFLSGQRSYAIRLRGGALGTRLRITAAFHTCPYIPFGVRLIRPSSDPRKFCASKIWRYIDTR